jgi:hypothetical protein
MAPRAALAWDKSKYLWDSNVGQPTGICWNSLRLLSLKVASLKSCLITTMPIVCTWLDHLRRILSSLLAHETLESKWSKLQGSWGLLYLAFILSALIQMFRWVQVLSFMVPRWEKCQGQVNLPSQSRRYRQVLSGTALFHISVRQNSSLLKPCDH